MYRDFLLHVHPDFFQDSALATERAVNEKNLKAFSQHLEQLQLLGHDGSGGDVRRSSFRNKTTSQLVFFLKQNGCAEHEPETDGSSDDSRPSPRKVILPLESHHQMATQIFELGITSTSIPPPTHHDSSTNHPDDHNSSRSYTTTTTSYTTSNSNSSNTNPDWHIWGDQFFGGSAANRAWDEAASARRRRQPHGRSAFSGDDDRSKEGRQKTTEWGAAFERAGGDAFSRLGHVLATDEGRALVRERRASSRNVRQLVGELRDEFGFGDFIFRCVRGEKPRLKKGCAWCMHEICVVFPRRVCVCF